MIINLKIAKIAAADLHSESQMKLVVTSEEI